MNEQEAVPDKPMPGDDEEGRKALLRNPFEGLMPKMLDAHRIARMCFPIQPLPHPAITAFYDQPLRKCDECGCTGCHEPGCSTGLMEDVHES